MTTDDKLAVSQEAREAAEEYLRSLHDEWRVSIGDDYWLGQRIALGQEDDHPLVQAFAQARLAGERADQWQDIANAPRDGTEFLSCGGPDNVTNKVQPTRWLSPGPYSTENGKNAEGQRRYQWPDGFYWAGYDGFVGPVSPALWQPLPEPPAIRKEAASITPTTPGA